MKQLLLAAFFLLVTVFSLHAQRGMTFQGVLRNNDGTLVSQQEVVLTVSVVSEAVPEEAAYQERHKVTTNEKGMFSLIVGSGDVLVGDLLDIDWQSGNFLLRALIESVAGEAWSLTSDMSLWAVPYTFFAGTADSVATWNFNASRPTGSNLFYWSGSSWEILEEGQAGSRLAIDSTGLPAWRLFRVPQTGAAVLLESSNTSATIAYSVVNDGGMEILRQGLVLSENPSPNVDRDRVFLNPGGEPALLLTSLEGDKTWYVRAFAENELGIGYGEVLSFELEGCFNEDRITLLNEGESRLTETKQALVTVAELNDLEYVEYYVNGERYLSDRIITSLPNPGEDFVVYARGIDSLGCISLSNELNFAVIATEGTAVCVPDFETPLNYNNLEAFSFAEEKLVGDLEAFEIQYDLSEGFDVVNLYSGNILDGGLFLGATYIGFPTDTLYFSETETAFYLVFSNLIPDSEDRLNNMRTYLAGNGLFQSLVQIIREDLSGLGYVEEFTAQKFTLVQQIIADLDLAFNDESGSGDAPNPLLTAIGSDIVFSPEGNTMFYGGQIQASDGSAISSPLVFSGEPLDDLSYVFRFLSRLFDDPTFQDALMFRSGSTSRFYPEDINLETLPNGEISIALDNGRQVVGEKYRDLSQLVEIYNTGLHFYHLLSLFPSFRAVDGLILSLSDGSPDDLACLEGFRSILEAEKSNFISIFLDDASGGEEALSLFSYVCFSLAESLLNESCTGTKSIYRLLNSLGNVATVSLDGYNALPFTDDVANATRSALHQFYMLGGKFYGKQDTLNNFESTFIGVPNSLLSPSPRLTLQEYAYYAEEKTADSTFLRVGELIPSALFSGGNQSTRVEVSFEPFVESVTLRDQIATSSPFVFSVDYWENDWEWKINNNFSGIEPGQRIKFGTITFAGQQQDIYGMVELPGIRYLADASVSPLVVVEVYNSSGLPVSGVFPVTFEIISGEGDLTDPELSGSGTETITLQTDASGRATVRWNRQGAGARLRASVVDGNGDPYDSVIISDGSEMVIIPAGTYTMGCTSEQGSDCESDESPAHTVSLESFYIGRFEVTRARWAAVMGEMSGAEVCPECPVTNISREEVLRFIDSLNAQTGLNYRLPTEAEWEFAARGGNMSQGYKYAGSSTVENVAWFSGNSPAGTSPVGQLLPNELGLFDMSGNAAEWCSDWYNDNYYPSSPENNPTGPASGTDAVVRGGSWQSGAAETRVAARGFLAPGSIDAGVGFRLARSVDLPEVETTMAIDITTNSANAGGNVLSDGGAEVTERGVVWNTTQNPTVADSRTIDGAGLGTFISGLIDLLPGTTYYIRAYASTEAGTAYGEELSFTTLAVMPAVQTISVSGVTDISAMVTGEVLSDGGATLTARGVVWGTETDPTLADGVTTEGTDLGTFVSTIGGLSPLTTYYARAYATNAIGTTYGETLSFTTVAGVPTVETIGLSGVTDSSAATGGNVTLDNGSPVTVRGIVWSTSEPPTVADNKTEDGSGLGIYVSQMTGLQPGTTYYVRAYATNGVGTGYGQTLTFATPPVLPVVETAETSFVTSNSTVSGGNVTYDGGAMVNARGIVWSTSPGPDLTDNVLTGGSGSGIYAIQLINLEPGTTYYIRAYATNVVGTAYGEEISFATPSVIPVVTTAEITSITDSSAVSGGNVTYDGGAEVTARGIVWGPNPNPTLADSSSVNGLGTGVFTSELRNLEPGTTYYVRAYATNEAGTGYGESISLVTLAVLPTVLTSDVSELTDSSAILGGNVLSDGGDSVNMRGIVWNIAPNPTLANTNTSNGGGLGVYTSELNGLSPGTTYYVRAYARNRVGTAYGEEISFTTPAVLPLLETDTISFITATGATSGGEVTYDGGAPVTARGIVWDLATEPTLADSMTMDGSGTGTFVSTLTNLEPGTKYYVRAYATNEAGTAYGEEFSFTTLAVLPVVETDTIVSISDSSAVGEGSVNYDGGANVTARGFVYGTNAGPVLEDSKTVNGSGTGSFSGTLSNLNPVTTYYFRAYATNSVGTAYGEEKNFTTPPAIPTVTTDTISNLTDNSATSGGEVVYDGGAAVTVRGVLWSTSAVPTLSDSLTMDGAGEGIFSSHIAGLDPGTTYYVRAYASNSAGTGYGAIVSFTTPAILATITTDSIISITDSSAVGGGTILFDGGATVTARGVVWSAYSGPTIDSMKTINGNGEGAFVSNITGLAPVTTYYVRAYAKNEAGTAYGQERSFTTPAALPTITTDTISSLTDSSAVSGGSIAYDGGAAVTARGVVWSTSVNPTLSDSLTLDGSGEGSFASNLNNLDPGTTYYVRAYATNAIGTAYGANVNFTTPAILPTITTDTLSAITDSSAVSGGNVLLDGGAPVTARGIVWGTLPNPTITGDHVISGTGTGTFVSVITGLNPVTTYYIRAYAINSVGIVYGQEYSFTTPVALPAVTTQAVTVLSDNQATGGGQVTDDGGGVVTVRGVVWDSAPNPVVSGMLTMNGNGLGAFSSTLNGLKPVTTYYARAYATNSAGTAYGNQVTFVTPAGLPSVTTLPASGVTDNSAASGGDVLFDGGAEVTARGVVYATHTQPTVADIFTTDGTGEGTFTSNLTGLAPGTLYYLRAYASNRVGTFYGEEVSFATPAIAPTVITASPTAVTDSSAMSGGEVVSDGGDSVIVRGVVWGTSTGPVLDSLYTEDGSDEGVFSSLIDSLSPVTTYYVRAYAINTIDTVYGEEYSFTTPAALPTVSTGAYTTLTDSSVVVGGTVSFNGGATVTARGLAWGRGPAPDLDSMVINLGSGEGTFETTLSGLDPETRYYVRAWATNATGTAYGDAVTFVTPAGLPRVTTLSVHSVTDSSAISGGHVTDDRGADITARGIVWSTSPNPVLGGSGTTDGTGTGIYASELDNLDPGTKYYIRAWATNAVGTTYGEQVSFTTPISMVLVQGGTFTMGCTPEQGGDCDADESAAHSVTLSSYYLAKYEVTQAEWEAVMGSNPSIFTGCPDCPVENVTYTDVQNFITRLNIETGYTYRLPTEAEWEYAARGGQETQGYKYAGGDGADSIGWYLDNAPSMTNSIGQKTPNELGLYDMSGNVWEWVSDWYDALYDATPVTDPTGPASGTNRVVRGGSWFSLVEDLRVSERTNYPPATQNNRLGFRLARSVSLPEVETFEITAVTDSTATGGGNVLTDGGSLVSARGVVWSTNPMPTLADDYTVDSSGMGTFVSAINNLDPGTTYYVRAYATNGVGTDYGGQITFTTPAVRPTVTTSSITAVTDVSAAIGGNVVDDGGATVTARGVAWSTSSLTPNISGDKTAMGSGTGMFSDTLTGLDPVTKYYVRAYATNSAGTAYGAVDSFTTNAGLPQLLTTGITGIMDSSAITGGNVITDSGDSVTVRGVVWSSSPNPTTADNKTTNGSDTGIFADTLSGLQPVTTYYVRAYATNGIGTAYGSQRTFTTLASSPVVGTLSASMQTDSSAVTGGNVIDDGGATVTVRGVVWGTSANPTIANNSTSDGSGTGSYSSSLSGLDPVTTYYVRAYATNAAGTAYGQQVTFTTPARLPRVTTADISGLTDSTITGGGDVTSNGGSAIIERGLVWGINPNPTTDSMQTNAVPAGTGSFTTTITGLSPVTTYYVRAFATNTIGTSYGSQKTITTLAALPQLTTATVTTVTDSSAVSGGNVLSDEGDSVLVKGIVWSTSPNPTTADNKTEDGSDTGAFVSSMTNLEPATTYYVRAYATNSIGTAYGAQRSFVTNARLATVTTISAAAITDTSATSGGNVVFDGGDSVTVKGIVWSTSPNPTLSDNVTTDGSDTGIFASLLEGLSPVTTYYIRAYATNSIGTAYGNQVSFQTAPGLATLTTTAITSITDSSAVSGGDITYDGGATVSARGVVWSTSPNPTIADALSNNGTGDGAYGSTIAPLDPGTTYYVRAYATNSVGTAYGQQRSFTTDSILATITTISLSGLTDTSVVTGGNITMTGGSTILDRGVVWSTSPNPTIVDDKTSDGEGAGSFVSRVTNLTYETSYYLRAYATNGVGTAYGNEIYFTTPAGLPVVSTDAVGEITQTTAVSGGNVTQDKGSPISARGVVWSTSPNPTLSNNYTLDGTGTGTYESEMTGLSAGTKYYVRAYATNDAGTSYGTQVSFTTPIDMVLVEGGSFDMGCTDEQTGCDTDEEPVHTVNISAFYLGTYEVSQAQWEAVMGTTPATFDGCDNCPVENVSWNAVQTFIDSLNTLTGLNYRLPTEAEWEYAARGGNMSAGYLYSGGNTAGTVAWYNANASGSTQERGQKAANELGIFDMSGNVGEWVSDWYDAAYYATFPTTDPAGPGMGSAKVFRGGAWSQAADSLRVANRQSLNPATGDQRVGFRLARSISLPSVTTTTVTGITDSSSIGGGNVTWDGGAPVTARGIVWSTSANPTLTDNTSTDGTGEGTFVSNLDNLDPGITYYVRAYATNGAGTAYGTQTSFTTPSILPTVETRTISSLSDTSAVSGGNVLANGGAAVTARGVVWGTGTTPTLDSMFTTDGFGLGTYISTLNSLDPVTTYYMRAYATNSVGTAYGQEISFTTPPGLPVVTTDSITNPTDSSAYVYGEVLLARGDSVTSRGFVWGTSPSPTLSDNFSVIGSDIGAIADTLTGLQSGTTYYVRAYATNSAGTGYGDELSFTTRISMVFVGGGSFTMGCTPEQGGDCDADESPSGTVTLSNFFMGKYEVTKAEWIAVLGSNPSTFAGCLDCPVENVTWNEVQEFIDSLNAQTGYTYRLPTEAEWEYAARGGNVSQGYKYSGSDDVNAVAWNFDNSDGKTWPVGQKMANELEIYDMSGNVYEWVSDWYDASYYNNYPLLNPTGPTMGTKKVARGGSWYVDALSHRVSNRDSFEVTFKNNRIGFRLALSIDLATVLTDDVTMITDSNAVAGGEVVAEGGSAVTEYGVVWGTSPKPVVTLDNVEALGMGTGTFTTTLDTLDPGTTYYVRAYAINSTGIAYAREVSFTTDTILPTVTTLPATMVTDSSAMSGGTVVADGGAAVTARGVVWSDMSTSPTIADSKSEDGTGIGAFTSSIDSLLPVTKYYFRAYATNNVGTAYGALDSLTTLAGPPEVSTDSITNITDSTVVAHANAFLTGGDPITERGIVWSTSPNPDTLDNREVVGSGIGTYQATLDTLSPGVTYYVRGYAINGIGIGYGNQLSVTTDTILPTVRTDSLTLLYGNYANGGGEVLSDGGAAVIARGIVWGQGPEPTLDSMFTEDGTGIGTFTSLLDTLQPVTKYYMRAYATNNVGTAYGDTISFTTPVLPPTVTTTAISSITDSTATGGGNVTDAGGDVVTARGVVWSTAPNPTISDDFTSNGAATGVYSSSLTGLLPVTTYYVRAYATNSGGTGYGEEVTFTTPAGVPRLTTTALSNVTDSTAVSGGTIVSDGGLSITNKGVVWSTSPNPTTSGSNTDNGSGTASFTSNLTGLEVGQRYFVRAYATNSAGTGYGNELSFTTSELFSMVLVPGGTFTMGCTAEQTGCDGDESPTHSVTLDSFLIGRYEVTQAQFESIMGFNPSVNDNTCTNCPVEGQSWVQFEAFIDELNTFTGLNYRFPTEAEWEFAARGGNMSQGYQYSGGDNLDSVGWYTGNASGATHPVGEKVPNELGIYDMSGNVYEFVSDWYDSYTAVADTNPTGPSSGTLKIVRGGAWGSAATFGRVASRQSLTTIAYNGTFGIRLARDFSYATVVTDSVATTTITDNSATVHANVTDDGNLRVLDRGVVWSTSPNPTLSNSYTTESGATGTYTTIMTGLAAGTTYYVRAYVTNIDGTTYGAQISFTTNP